MQTLYSQIPYLASSECTLWPDSISSFWKQPQNNVFITSKKPHTIEAFTREQKRHDIFSLLVDRCNLILFSHWAFPNCQHTNSLSCLLLKLIQLLSKTNEIFSNTYTNTVQKSTTQLLWKIPVWIAQGASKPFFYSLKKNTYIKHKKKHVSLLLHREGIGPWCSFCHFYWCTCGLNYILETGCYLPETTFTTV